MAKKLPARSRSRSVAQHGTVAREVSVDAELLTGLRGQIAAINRSQAVIEFDPSGHVLTANDNFREVIGNSGSSSESAVTAAHTSLAARPGTEGRVQA